MKRFCFTTSPTLNRRIHSAADHLGRPSCFLIITLEVFREIVMDDKTDVGLIYPHPECDRRVTTRTSSRRKLPALRRARYFQSGVIWLGLKPRAAQFLRQAVGRLPACAINDAAFVGMFAQKCRDLREWIALCDDAIRQVWAVEACDVTPGIF